MILRFTSLIVNGGLLSFSFDHWMDQTYRLQ